MKKNVLFLVGIAISLLLLWLAVRTTDTASIAESLSSAEWAWIVPFLIVLFVFYWLKSGRWAILLAPVATLSTRDLFPAVMIGYAGSAIMPMQLGEVVRAFVCSRKFGIPLSSTLSSLGMEKIFDLLTILVFLAVLMNVGVSVPNEISAAGYSIGGLALIGFAIIVAVLLRPTWFESTLDDLFGWLAPATQDALKAQFYSILRGMAAVRSARSLAMIIGSSVAQWALMGICIFVSLIAVGITVPAYGIALVLIATVIGISLPSSPGFVGNIQFAFVIALNPLGVPAGDAIAASVFYHLIAYASVVIVGFAFLYGYGYGIRTLGQLAESAEDNTERQ